MPTSPRLFNPLVEIKFLSQVRIVSIPMGILVYKGVGRTGKLLGQMEMRDLRQGERWNWTLCE